MRRGGGDPAAQRRRAGELDSTCTTSIEQWVGAVQVSSTAANRFPARLGCCLTTNRFVLLLCTGGHAARVPHRLRVSHTQTRSKRQTLSGAGNATVCAHAQPPMSGASNVVPLCPCPRQAPHATTFCGHMAECPVPTSFCVTECTVPNFNLSA